MRILILTHFLGRGGSSSMALQVRDHFQQQGHDAHILATSHTADAINDTVEFLFPETGLSRKKILTALLDRIRVASPDLIYSLSGTIELDVLRYLDIPRVRHFCSLESHDRLCIRHIYRQAIPYLEGVTANTPDVLDILKAWAPDAKFQTATFPYALNSSLWEKPLETPEIPKDRPLQICFVGRLEDYQKRAHWLPRIIADIAKSSIATEWHIYGDGPLRASIAEQTGRIPSAPPIHFHEWVTQSELVSRLPAHDLFFLCSRWEGLPIAMVEAMLCGVACLVPDTCAGAGYALDDGGGWLYKADSPKACSASLRGVLADPGALLAARRQAAASARQKFLGEMPARQMSACLEMFSSLQFNGRVVSEACTRLLSPLPPLPHLKSRILYRLSRFFKK